jgi:RimJ/RimL family protein N-acetyltransferase
VKDRFEPHPVTGQPIGLRVADATPAQRPGPMTLQGHFGRVERLDISHAPAMWRAVEGHDSIWTYMSRYGPFADKREFTQWVASRIPLQDPYSYAVIDANGNAVGIVALMEIRPEHRVCEMGHVVYSPFLQRTPLATEAQYLIAKHVFETLGYRRYEWKCECNNAASRRAAQRLGFTFEFVMKNHMIAKGRNRDTAWFSMLDTDWPRRKTSFERWLSPDNFNADGTQKFSLGALNGVHA